MTTRNIAPRENGEGSIGTQIKRWLKGFFNALDVSGNVDVGGNVTATGNISVGGNLSVTGTATGITPAATDNSTKLATTAFVKGFQRAEGWNASTSYAVGNTVRVSTLPSQYLLSCATAGTSSDTEPNCTGASIGDTVYDGSIEWFVMAYLPVTGGTMQGDITLTNNAQIKNSIDNGLVRIQGGRDENMGARVVLSGKSRSTNPGAFELVANNGTTSRTLIGHPNGTLKWGNDNVITSAGGTMTGVLKKNANAISSEANNQYTRFLGGLDDSHGASLTLAGNTHSWAGKWELKAHNGTNSKVLAGTAAGALTWGGKKVLVEDNGITTSQAYLSFYLNSKTPGSGAEDMQLGSTLLQLYGKNVQGVNDIYLNGDILGTRYADKFTVFCGNDDTHPSLAMWGHGSSTNAGCFRLRATIQNDSSRTSSLIGKPDGTLLWGGNNVLTDATVGSRKSASISSSVSLTASTAKTITSVSLGGGVWVVTGHVHYSNVTSSKVYGITISTSGNSYGYANDGSIATHSSGAAAIAIQTMRILALSDTTTVYLCGYASANVTASDAQIVAVRIV